MSWELACRWAPGCKSVTFVLHVQKMLSNVNSSRLLDIHPCFLETCRPVYPGCVCLQIQAPWETCNQRTHYLRQVCCTRACGVLVVSLSVLHSHWPFVAFTQSSDWVAFSMAPSPLFRWVLWSLRVCSFSWVVRTAQRTNKCCCLAGQLRDSPVWAVCLWSEGPWGLDFL